MLLFLVADSIIILDPLSCYSYDFRVYKVEEEHGLTGGTEKNNVVLSYNSRVLQVSNSKASMEVAE